MTKILTKGYVNITRLSAAQAKSADGKPRLAVQGVYDTVPATGKGKKATPKSVHEFSFLRPDKPDTVPGRYFWLGKLVIEVAEEPDKTHEANDVRYARHKAELVFARFDMFEPADGAQPF